MHNQLRETVISQILKQRYHYVFLFASIDQAFNWH